MTGRLAPYDAAYGRELRKRGYTSRSAVNELRQVARLSRWLGAGGLTVAELNGGRVEEFLAFQRSTGQSRSYWSRPALLCLSGLWLPSRIRGRSGRR